MRDAAQAKQAMQGMADAAKAYSSEETSSAAKAAQARSADINAIRTETAALSQLGATAKQTNTQLLYGGRNDMQQHLADQAQLLNYTNLLNRAEWMGFSTVQQAMSYRQQMYQQKLLENKADFGGYLTADQFLGYLARRTASLSAEAVAIRARAAAVQTETAAMLAYDNAVQGTHSSIGQLGEGISSAQAYTAALTGVPPVTVTRAEFDAGPALAMIAAYRASLGSIPAIEGPRSIPAESTLAGMFSDREPEPAWLTLRQAPRQAPRQWRMPDESTGLDSPGGSAPVVEAIEEMDDALTRAMDRLTDVQRSADSRLALPPGGSEPEQDWRPYSSPLPPEPAEAGFDDTGASAELQGWVDDLTRAVRDRYVFAAQFDDTGALDDLNGFVSQVRRAGLVSASVGGNLFAGSGGETGALSPPAADLPNPNDARGFGLLADSEDAAREAAADAITELRELAVVTDSAADSANYLRAANVLQAASDRALTDAGQDVVRNLAEQALGAEDSARAARIAGAAWMQLARAENQAAAGGSSGRGGGSGGAVPPRPPAGGSGDGGDEPPFGEGEEAAARALADEMNRLANESYAAADAEQRAGQSAQEAIGELLGMARAAAAAGDAASASRYAWAAGTLNTALLRAMGTAAEDDVTAMSRLAAAAGDAGDAARYAYAASQMISAGLAGIKDPAAQAAQALVQGGNSAQYMGRWMGFLTRDITLWSGLLGDTHMIGQVQLWHILMDGLIEVLAVWVPALATAAVGLLAWGAAGYKAAHEIYDQMMNVHTVSTALQTVVAPLTDTFQKLEAAVRPQVYELFGDALTIMSAKTGAFNSLIMKTGDYLDRLAARIVTRMQAGGKGMQDFFSAGAKDLAMLGQAFDALGSILLKFLQATAITHIAEDLLAVGTAVLTVVADILKITPTPVLVFLLAVHGLLLWGGLAVDVLGKVVIGVAGLASRFDVLSAAAMGVARYFGAADDVLAQFAGRTAGVKDLLSVLGDEASAEKLGQLSVAIEGTGQSIEDFVRSAGPLSALRLSQFSSGLDEAGTKTVALGIAAGASDGELGQLARNLSGVAVASADAGAESGGFFASLGDAVPLLSNAYVDIGLLAAALVGLGVYLGLRTNQTQKWIETLDTAVSKASLFTALGTTVSALAATTTELGRAQSSGVGDAAELGNAQADLSGKLQAELIHTGDIAHAYGVSMPTALALMNAAGVTTSQLFTRQAGVWQVAEQQVRGLVQGYQAMGQQIGTVGSDLNALLISESSQLKSMQSLNTAYDSWTGIVSAPVSDFLALDQAINQFEADAGQAGSSMLGLGTNLASTAGQAGRAAPVLSNAAIQLQQQFEAVYSSVEQAFDAMRNSSALTGSGGFTSFVKDAVAALIPLAGGNKAAAAQISALAQEAGGPATASISTLRHWVGDIKNPLQDMYDASQQAAIGASNLSQDAARLTSTLQSELNPAMASAEFNAYGGQKAFSAFASDLVKFGPDSQVTIAAGRDVARELLSVDKNSASAKAQFAGWAESMGLSKDQANKLWAEVSKGVKPVLGIRDALGQAAGAQANLVKPGVWGQFEHDAMAAFDKIKSHPIAFGILGALNFISGVTTGLDAAGRVVTAFFGRTLPDLVTRSLPHMAGSVAAFFAGPFATAVDGAWAHVWSALADPVERAFGDVKTAITTGFDGWWAHHGSELEEVWRAVWSALSTVASYGAGKLEESAKVLWAGLQQIWHGGSASVTGIATAFWHLMTSLAQGFWQLLGPLVRIGWALVAGLFQVGAALVSGIFQDLWAGLTMMARVFWSALEAAVKVAWDVIVGIFSVALDLITGHWSQAWADIRATGVQVWNALKGFYTGAWADLRQMWDALGADLKSTWGSVWTDIRSVAEEVWSNLKSGFDSVVSSIKSTWGTLEGIFRGPVGFLVNTVYDQGIARLWNDVMGAINGPKLPTLKFTGGGRLPGYGGGDTVPAWIRGGGPALLEPGEAIVDKDRTRKYAHVLKAMGVPGFQGGGIITDVTGAIGSALTGATHGIEHILGDAVDVAKIAGALATGNTTALENALSKLIGPGGASGELAGMITGIPKTLISHLLSEAKSAAASAVGADGSAKNIGSGGGTATPGLVTVAKYVMAHGGTKAAGAGVGGTVAGESGGNPEAEEAGGGGGTGLIQWTPGSSARPYQPLITGNAGRDMAVQLADMMYYISSRGGIGEINAGGASGGAMGAAEVFSRMEAPLVPGSDIRSGVVEQLYAQGYAAGGEVRVPYLQGLTAGTAHNVLVAAGLRPQASAGQKAGWYVSGSSPRGDDSVPPHYGVWINAEARTKASGLKVPDLRGYQAGTAHNILAAMGLSPTAPAGQKATWQVTGSKPGYDTGTRKGAHVEILASAPVTPGPKGSTPPKGMSGAQAWDYYSSELAGLATAQKNEFWDLYNIKLPKAATKAQLADWADDKKALDAAQSAMAGVRDPLLHSLKNPTALTAGEFFRLQTDLANVKSLEYGKSHPDWNWPAWHYERATWNAANQATAAMQADVGNTYTAWKSLYGPGGSLTNPALYNTPGVMVTPEGGAPVPVDLQSLVTGGPANPVVTTGPSSSATGMGFMTGGLVPGGSDGASLSQVAAMFALGSLPPQSALSLAGLGPGTQAKLAAASSQTQARTLSDAAGERVGLKIGNLTVNNPVSEKTSDTIARSTNRLAFLAGRQPV